MSFWSLHVRLLCHETTTFSTNVGFHSTTTKRGSRTHFPLDTCKRYDVIPFTCIESNLDLL